MFSIRYCTKIIPFKGVFLPEPRLCEEITRPGVLFLLMCAAVAEHVKHHRISNAWPKDLPPVHTLLQHARECTNDSLFHRKVIDAEAVQQLLDKAVQKVMEGEAFTRCGLLQLPIRRRFLYCFMVLFISMIAYAVWRSFREGITGGIALATMAFCAGVLTVMMAPVLQIQQKHIDKN